MKNKKMILLMWALALAPFVLVALSWNRLPDLVPLHWNTANQVDSYAPKSRLWLLCCIAPVLSLLFQFLPKIDPKKENYGKFQGKYDLFGPILPGILLIALLFTVSEAIEPGALPIGKLLLGAVSIVLMVAGNIMGKVKTNWFMGIRTPWSLSDPDVWAKTNRMGGWVFFLGGLVTLILCLVLPAEIEEIAVFAMLGIFVVGMVATYFMSWKWYRDKFKGGGGAE